MARIVELIHWITRASKRLRISGFALTLLAIFNGKYGN